MDSSYSMNNITTRASREMTSRKIRQYFRALTWGKTCQHWHVAGQGIISDCLVFIFNVLFLYFILKNKYSYYCPCHMLLLPRPRRGLRGIVFTRSVCLSVCVCVCVCLSVCVSVCPANILVFYFSAIRRDIDLKFIQDTYRVVLNSLK